jgi:hypothetical protein
MTASRPRRALCLLAALAALALALALSACGAKEGIDVSEGQPVQLGELQYNVVFTRLLNPSDVEDAEYLVGQPAPKPDQLYLGVFVQILNKSHQARLAIPAASGWVITDSDGNQYLPLSTDSPYALKLGDEIGPEDQAPAADSTPQVGPIEGALVLFSIPDAATELRPLTLSIPGAGGPAEVELDM